MRRNSSIINKVAMLCILIIELIVFYDLFIYMIINYILIIELIVFYDLFIYMIINYTWFLLLILLNISFMNDLSCKKIQHIILYRHEIMFYQFKFYKIWSFFVFHIVVNLNSMNNMGYSLHFIFNIF
jgi:hypothetical protein